MERTVVSRVFQMCLDFDRRIRDGGYSQVDKSTLDGGFGGRLGRAGLREKSTTERVSEVSFHSKNRDSSDAQH